MSPTSEIQSNQFNVDKYLMQRLIQIIKGKRADLSELELFSDVCMQSLVQASHAVERIDVLQRISEVLGEPTPYSSEVELTEAKARASKVAVFASAQRDHGAPYLFSLCAVRLWTVMEALVDELVIAALHSPDNRCNKAVLGKLKGPLVEFLSSSKEEQAELLAETLKQAVDAPLKLGAGRFEAMLEPVGLGGCIADEIRKALFELSQVRNNIVHKSGKADRRLIEACPWLGLRRGEPVHVSSRMFRRYISAAYWYVVELKGRADERNGAKRPTEVGRALEMLLQIVDSNQPAAIKEGFEQTCQIKGSESKADIVPSPRQD